MSEQEDRGQDTAATRTGAGHTGTPIASAQSLGRYQILSVAGTGGMGRVYAAFDPQLDRRVALKVVHGQRSDAHQKRAAREAKALARVSHPNVVAIHEVDEDEGQLLIAMEFVKGRTLKTWMAEHPPTQTQEWLVEALDVLLQAGRGLAAAHEVQLVHRDFKPSNVLVGEDGRVRVVDFGLARDVLQPGLSEATNESTGSGSGEQVTRTGAVVGTPAYMAPEQTAGGTLDGRTDQFAFCVTAWEVLFGVRPKVGAIEHPKESVVPPGLEKALRKGLSKGPSGRFATMDALLERLEAERDALLGVRKRSGWRWVMAAMAVPLVYGGVALGQRAMTQREVAACEQHADVMDQAWNAETRERLAGVIATSPVGKDSRYVDAVVGGLDDSVHRWRDEVDASCKLSIQDEAWSLEQEAAVQWCLDDKRLEIETVLDVLLAGDERVTAFAYDAVSDIGFDRDCLEPNAQPPLPPEGVRHGDDLAHVRTALLRARALAGTGQRSTSATVAKEALTLAETTGWEPVVAEANMQVYGAIVETADIEEALGFAREAVAHAVRGNAWSLAASAAVALGDRSSASEPGDLEDAVYWMDLAESLLSLSGGGTPLQTAVMMSARSRSLRRLGELDASTKAARRAVEIYTEMFGLGHPRTALSERLLAEVLIEQGDLEEAERTLAHALEVLDGVLGGRSSAGLFVRQTTIELLRRQGRLDDAEIRARAVLGLAQEILGAESHGTGIAYRDLGIVLSERGKWAQAQRSLAESSRMLSKTANRPERLALMLRLLEACDKAGDLEAAETVAKDLAEVAEGEGVSAKWKADAFIELANYRVRRQQIDAALGDFDKAFETTLAEFGPEHGTVATILSHRSNALLGVARYEEALEPMQRALEIYEAAVSSDHDLQCSEMHESLGRIHRGLGNKQEALEAWALTQEIRLKSLPADDEISKRAPAFIAELCTEDSYAPACDDSK